MVKLAIIGSGFGMYGLLPAFSQTSNCEVIALCANTSERVQKAVTKYHVPLHVQDWRLLFKTAEFDAVAIAVTPSVQYEIAKTALENNQHVFAEKPLAATLDQAGELKSLAAAHRRTTAVDFIFSEVEAFKQLKLALQKNMIGTPHHFSLIWNFQSMDSKRRTETWKTNPQLGGGAVSYYFSHLLFVLEQLFGRITVTQSQLRYANQMTRTTELGVDLKLANQLGLIGEAHFQSDADQDLKHELVIQGSSGELRLLSQQGVTGHFHVTRIQNGQTKSLPAHEEIGQADEDERVPIIKKMSQKFIDACRLQTDMSPSFEDGYRVQELIDEIRQKASHIA